MVSSKQGVPDRLISHHTNPYLIRLKRKAISSERSPRCSGITGYQDLNFKGG